MWDLLSVPRGEETGEGDGGWSWGELGQMRRVIPR